MEKIRITRGSYWSVVRVTRSRFCPRMVIGVMRFLRGSREINNLKKQHEIVITDAVIQTSQKPSSLSVQYPQQLLDTRNKVTHVQLFQYFPFIYSFFSRFMNIISR